MVVIFQIAIRVTDVNDHAPMFPFSTYTSTVRENSDVTDQIITLLAVDQDMVNNVSRDIFYCRCMIMRHLPFF